MRCRIRPVQRSRRKKRIVAEHARPKPNNCIRPSAPGLPQDELEPVDRRDQGQENGELQPDRQGQGHQNPACSRVFRIRKKRQPDDRENANDLQIVVVDAARLEFGKSA